MGLFIEPVIKAVSGKLTIHYMGGHVRLPQLAMAASGHGEELVFLGGTKKSTNGSMLLRQPIGFGDSSKAVMVGIGLALLVVRLLTLMVTSGSEYPSNMVDKSASLKAMTVAFGQWGMESSSGKSLINSG